MYCIAGRRSEQLQSAIRGVGNECETGRATSTLYPCGQLDSRLRRHWSYTSPVSCRFSFNLSRHRSTVDHRFCMLQRYRRHSRIRIALPTHFGRTDLNSLHTFYLLAGCPTVFQCVPYILAYKSQNLRQNLDLKVGGATYTRVIN